MKYLGFTISALVAITKAHSTITNIYVNDVNQGIGNTASGYIRSPPNNSPVKDITSKDMTCNVNNVATSKTVDVVAGDKITLEWHHDSVSDSDDIIDKSHKGPVMVYIAPTTSNGAGDVWVKLAEDGFDGSQWAVDKLIANRGKHSFTLPSVLADGEYLVRGEIIALHEADATFNVNAARGAQFYMECVQIKVTGGGATTLPAGVAIPGAYAYTDPGVFFNLYGSFTSYTIPGPDVWDQVSGTSPSLTSAITTPITSIPTSSTSLIPSSITSSSVVVTSSPEISATSSQSPVSASTGPVTSIENACGRPSPTTFQTVASPTPSVVATVAKYGQCGGTGFTGSTICASGSTCTVQNPYYSQCI